MLFTTFASIWVLAFALSLDSFGVGITYGMRRLRMPWTSVIVIAICSGLIILLSMQVGQWMMSWVSPTFASRCGAMILIIIGIIAILQFIRSSSNKEKEASISVVEDKRMNDTGPFDPIPVIQLQLKRVGIIIQILRTPAAADLDRSGTISATEAAWLGAALSLDAFGAGIGAAMIGYPAFWTALFIALFSGIFLKLGQQLGAVAVVRWSWMKKLTFLPGCVLIIMGIMKLL